MKFLKRKGRKGEVRGFTAGGRREKGVGKWGRKEREQGVKREGR